ncbi:MAG: L,D-transpeptidase [Actinomycetota bacterium]|nr:L,D-transpeptidase [Actinomycetota bacterium]
MDKFFNKKNYFKKGTLPCLIIRTVIVIIIFTLVTTIFMSCTGNFEIKESYIADGAAGSAVFPPGVSTIAGRGSKAGTAEKVYLKRPGRKELDEVENPSEGDNVDGNEDDPENEVMGDENEESEAEQEQEVYGEINEGSSEQSAGDDMAAIDFNDAGSFRIEVNLLKQVVYVFYREELIRKMVCSGGTVGKPTPEGEFKTTQQGEYFWSDKYNIGAYYWIRFHNDYLFHSVPFDAEGQMIVEENEKLGTHASHGCIRLGLEDAAWMYDMLPLGIKVLIYR